MIEMFLKMQNKRRAKGGFTLVELIVVLVILAILAALLIPALTGYIDKAKDKSVIAETRQAVMAAQTLVDEKYGTVAKGTAVTVGEGKNVTYAEIKTLAEVKGEITAVTLTADNKIATLTYTHGKTCTYTANPTGNTEMYNVA